MPETGSSLVRHYIEDIMAAEQHIETQLRDFAAAEDDDQEVQDAFANHAEQTRFQQQRLSDRLDQLGEHPGNQVRGDFASLLNVAPQIVQSGNIVEERTLQNLIVSYTVELGECALYETLAAVAHAAGDNITEALARQIQMEERATAEKLWHFLPSRSKIAFNMLTISELDPAVETKLADDRLIES